MKTLVVALAFMMVAPAAMAKGECKADQLMAAIQAKCGAKVEYANWNVQHMGEVSDTYTVKVRVGNKESFMNIVVDDGGLACTKNNLTVPKCPQ